MEAPGYWDNVEKSQEGMKELNILKEEKQKYESLEQQYEDIETLLEMGYEENDESLIPEIQEELDQFTEAFEAMRIKTLLSGEYDSTDAIIKLNAGAGGTESCDWAGMLYRMSPFNAQGKRQTSFVSCDVMPDIEGDIEVEINPDDLRIDTYRSSGAGGQHINKTSSAIRITHIPTGIVVQCQNERSQHQNKDKAMQMLKAKLYLLEQQKQAEKLSGIRGEVSDIAWGNQIRSYVMQPYTLVKDHRTSCEVSNVDAVMDGKIDPFINAYLKWINLSPEEQE